MAVRKRRYRSGKVTWGYSFEAPGSTRQNRDQKVEWGFKTKKEAIDAEAARRLAVQAEHEAAQAAAAASPAAPPPKTLRERLDDFYVEYCDRQLERKTVERYRQTAAYLAPELLATAIDAVTPFVLTREWSRLHQSGGHHRKTKQARPLSVKTVRNFAGVVSSAYAWACSLGMVNGNPVKDSKFPRDRKREAVVLTVQQQKLLLDSADWNTATVLKLGAATGARRGELLALRWTDLMDGHVWVRRSLSQTKAGLAFKEPKTSRSKRPISLAPSTIALLAEHRKKQEIFRKQFGPTYRADLDLIIAQPDGEPLRPDTLSAAVSALCQRLKLPKGASLHTLRHTHGSHLLANGVDIATVSKRLGHANTAVTAAIYAHALDGRDEEAARVWEEFQDRAVATKPQ